MTHPPQ